MHMVRLLALMYRFEWSFIVLHDVNTNTLQTLTSMFDIAEHTGYVVSDFPIQAPIYLYTTMAFMSRNIAEIMWNM